MMYSDRLWQGTDFLFILSSDLLNFRENLVAPLIVTDMFGRIDIEAKVLEGPYGLSIVPRAVRHGASLGIAALFPETKTKLRDSKWLMNF